MSGYPVVTPSDQPGAGVQHLIRDLTTTRQSKLFPSGAKVLFVSYRLLPGATAVTNQFAKLVINAVSDADATAKLATDGAFIPLFQGDDKVLSFTPGNEATRVDIVTEQAVGAEKTIVDMRGVL